MTEPQLELFLVVAPGLAHFLAEEARGLGLKVTLIDAAGVHVKGDWTDVMRANLNLRGATRVLVRVATFRAMHLAQLDKRSRKLPWSDWLRPETPVRVEATCRKSRIYHAKAASERVEHALVAAGYTVHPDAALTLKLRIEDDLATLSIDTSGPSLHKRGLKTEVNKAPMRETLAALFLRAAGFDGSQPVYDPMCGSGTFVLEAAEIASGRQAGRARRFAFEDLVPFDQGGMDALRHRPGPEPDVAFFGSDRDAGAVQMSRKNAERAGIAEATTFKLAAVSEAIPPDGPPGLVITNPPYGARLGKKSRLHGVYGAFGKAMQDRFKGWHVALVTSDTGLAKSTGLPWQSPGPIVDHGGTKVRLWQARL